MIYMPEILPQLPIISPPPIECERRSPPSMRWGAVEDAEQQVDLVRLFPAHIIASP